ncbi:MAG TPA: hypothetical protein VGS41_14250, partial [Chthonomonadales bacterium]|nr:hypothetical protein [Chthonomonadales bacterium]
MQWLWHAAQGHVNAAGPQEDTVPEPDIISCASQAPRSMDEAPSDLAVDASRQIRKETEDGRQADHLVRAKLSDYDRAPVGGPLLNGRDELARQRKPAGHPDLGHDSRPAAEHYLGVATPSLLPAPPPLDDVPGGPFSMITEPGLQAVAIRDGVTIYHTETPEPEFQTPGEATPADDDSPGPCHGTGIQRRTITVTAAGAARLPRTLPGIWNLPARNPGFTGRQGLLAAMRETLQSGGQVAVQALRGMGGVGKT